MPCLRQIQRSATVTFAPHANLIATGSVSGAVDASFSTDSTLQIYSVNFASQETEPPQCGGSVTVSETFERLTWGASALDPTRYPMGLIAGGLSDGFIGIWDPAVILRAETGSKNVEGALVAKLEGHTGPIRGLDWNGLESTQLASGALDGECLIWDLSDLDHPSSTKLGGLGAQQRSGSTRPEMGPVAWNPRFAKILATGLSNGTVVIWDLKGSKPKPVVTLRNPSGPHRVNALTWSPEDSWTLATASDSDSSPDVQLWDLRNSGEPKAALRGHGAGVLALSWCHQDGTYLLSSAKDNRTIIWDSIDLEVVAELPRSGNWNFAVQWSPRIPGVFATASFDGKVSMYNLQTCELPDSAAAGRGDFASLLSTASTRGPPKPLRKAPAWLLRPVSAALGFGGKLVSVVQSPVPKEGVCLPRTFKAATVEIKQVVAEQALVLASEQFEEAARGDSAALLEYCARKAESCHGSEAETWSFLRIMFHGQPIAELLKLLGFEDMLPSEPAPPETTDGGPLTDAMGHLSTNNDANDFAQAISAPEDETATGQPSEANEDFLSNLGGNHGPDILSSLRSNDRGGGVSGTATEEDESPRVGTAVCAPGPQEDRIQRALYAGNFTSAVNIALEADRFADAMAIAALPGAPEGLWERSQKRFMEAVPRPYMVIAKCIRDSDFRAIVSSRPLSAWRETMAIVATYTGTDTFSLLLRSLADKLWKRGNRHPATLCWVVAGAVDEAVAAWTLDTKGAASSVETLQALMERTVIFGVAAGAEGAAPAAGELMSRYASILAAQGRLATALQYLDLAPGNDASDTAVLRDRIYQAGGPSLAATSAPPAFPFDVEDITALPSDEQLSSFSGGGNGGEHWGVPPPAPPLHPGPPSSSAFAVEPQGGARAGGGQPGGGFAGRSSFQPQQQAMPPPPHQGFRSTPPPPPAPFVPQTTMQPSRPQPPAVTYTPEPPKKASNFAHSVAAYIAPQQQQQQNQQQQQQPQYRQAPPPQSFAASRQASVAAAPVAAAAYRQPGPPPAQQQQYQQGLGRMPAAPVSPQGASLSNGSSFGGGGGGGRGGPAQQQPPPLGHSQAYQAGYQAPPPPPAAPTGPPPTCNLSNVDTKQVAPEMKGVESAIRRLFEVCSAAAPNKAREMADNSKRLGGLLWRMNIGDFSPRVTDHLKQLGAALNANDIAGATAIQLKLTTDDWDECCNWLTALKRVLKLRSTLG